MDAGTPGGDAGTNASQYLNVSLEGMAPGSTVSAMRLRPGVPAEESLLSLLAEETNLTLPYQREESLSVTVNAPDGTVARLLSGGGEPHGPSSSTRVRLVPAEYATIQAAIDAAKPGEVVRVLPGTYFEHVKLKRGVHLQGSGASVTLLDGQQGALPLVDLSNAPGSVVSGFTFQGVTERNGSAFCSSVNADDCFCLRTSALYADGHDWVYPPLGAYHVMDQSTWTLPSVSPPALVTQNIFRDNYIGVGLYFHPLVHVRNNLFLGNEGGVVAKCFQDRTLIANNVFWENRQAAITSQAGYLDILNNIIARSPVGISWDYVQTGQVRCNLFFDNGAAGTRVTIGTDGNIIADPRFVAPERSDFHVDRLSPAVDSGCFQGQAVDPEDRSPQDRGAYGGPWGHWTGE
ncbi:right-handed parallel beta-helix repeat-containing protein [Archangium gephyra]|nr:NosD domain-containing protein [Archangium gephyra]AKJ01860.1 Hypothetical protein AA314_03486 [Archangium gephyra]